MTPALIRAARALLNWRQQDLAKAAGLSLSAIIKFESETGKTRSVSVQAMVGALKEAGIEFPATGGVRQIEDATGVQRIAGDDFVQKLNEDIYACVKKPGEEILSCSVDEGQWFVPSIKKTAEKYYKWRRTLGVKQYYLVPEGNAVFESPRSHYRFLPPNLIGKIAFLIYADRIALVSWRRKQIFILRGAQLTEPFREQFKLLWRLAKKA